VSGPQPAARRVALLTLGCARNEVDSEELAARLSADGWQVTTDGSTADVVLVNTCGFVEKAKADSIETLASSIIASVTAFRSIGEEAIRPARAERWRA